MSKRDSLLLTLGERIQNARRRQKLSQTELGKRVGISTNGLSAIERGAADARVSTVAKIAEGLDIALSELCL